MGYYRGQKYNDDLSRLLTLSGYGVLEESDKDMLEEFGLPVNEENQPKEEVLRGGYFIAYYREFKFPQIFTDAFAYLNVIAQDDLPNPPKNPFFSQEGLSEATFSPWPGGI